MILTNAVNSLYFFIPTVSFSLRISSLTPAPLLCRFNTRQHLSMVVSQCSYQRQDGIERVYSS